MRLYDNDAYREDFVTGVYDVLSNDPTWERANQIIQLFDNAPVVEEPPNAPLALEELREMDGEPVWVVQSGYESRWYLVDAFWKAKNIIRIYAAHGPIMAADLLLEDEARFYRRKPEEM